MNGLFWVLDLIEEARGCTMVVGRMLDLVDVPGICAAALWLDTISLNRDPARASYRVWGPFPRFWSFKIVPSVCGLFINIKPSYLFENGSRLKPLLVLSVFLLGVSRLCRVTRQKEQWRYWMHTTTSYGRGKVIRTTYRPSLDGALRTMMTYRGPSNVSNIARWSNKVS